MDAVIPMRSIPETAKSQGPEAPSTKALQTFVCKEIVNGESNQDYIQGAYTRKEFWYTGKRTALLRHHVRRLKRRLRVIESKTDPPGCKTHAQIAVLPKIGEAHDCCSNTRRRADAECPAWTKHIRHPPHDRRANWRTAQCDGH